MKNLNIIEKIRVEKRRSSLGSIDYSKQVKIENLQKSKSFQEILDGTLTTKLKNLNISEKTRVEKIISNNSKKTKISQRNKLLNLKLDKAIEGKKCLKVYESLL